MTRRLLLVEDHPIYAEALCGVVRRAFPAMAPTVAVNLETAIAVAERHSPTMVLLDLWLPDTHGLEGLLALRRIAPRALVVVVSAFDDDAIVDRTLVLGAAGFISKTWCAGQITQALIGAINGTVVVPTGPDRKPLHMERNRPLAENGGRECEQVALPCQDRHERSRPTIQGATTLNPLSRVLTQQQVRVLEKLCEGKLNKQIAHELDIGETTVKAHVGEILRKLDVGSRTQAVVGVASLDFAARMMGLARVGERVVARPAHPQQAILEPHLA